MVKLQDGSLVMASSLINGEAEDQEGNKIKFQPAEQGQTQNQNQTASGLISMLRAEQDTSDGKKQIYTVDFGNTLVKVSVSTIEQDKEKKPEGQEADENKDKSDEQQQEKAQVAPTSTTSRSTSRSSTSPMSRSSRITD